jgi:ribonuclease HI
MPTSNPPTINAIYTDGACSGNPGTGGWGVVVYFQNGSVHEMGGASSQTTNNRMELQAAIAALDYWQQLHPSQPITLYTDSEYVKNGITKWIKGWKKKGWKTSAGKAVLNQDLWQELDALNTAKVTWEYVRGHAGNEGNERCDAIARAFSQGTMPTMRQRSSPQPDTTPDFPPDATPEVAETAEHAADPDVQSSHVVDSQAVSSDHIAMNDSPSTAAGLNGADTLPREVRVAQMRNLVETLHMADEVASQGYLITSAELADLMDINASAVTSRGNTWVWRNWMVSRVRREGNQILWQLERID